MVGAPSPFYSHKDGGGERLPVRGSNYSKINPNTMTARPQSMQSVHTNSREQVAQFGAKQHHRAQGPRRIPSYVRLCERCTPRHLLYSSAPLYPCFHPLWSKVYTRFPTIGLPRPPSNQPPGKSFVERSKNIPTLLLCLFLRPGDWRPRRRSFSTNKNETPGGRLRHCTTVARPRTNGTTSCQIAEQNSNGLRANRFRMQ